MIINYGLCVVCINKKEIANWRYTSNPNETIILTKYTGIDKTITVPTILK